MNPFAVLAAFLPMAMALIGYGVYSESPWAGLLGAAVGFAVIAFVLSSISNAKA